LKEINLQEQLVQQCMSGDAKAQRMLYGQYSKAMYNICLRMVNNRMDAEDVLQNSFIEVFKGIKSFRGNSTIGAWIKRIVINNNIDFLKKRKIYFEEIDDKAVIKVEEEKLNNNVYDVGAVKHNIALLPDGYRVVLSLYLLEGYDHKEIGEILDVTESTSKSQYSRAKKKLKELIASDMLKKEVI